MRASFMLVIGLLFVFVLNASTFGREIEVHGKVTCDGKPLKDVVMAHKRLGTREAYKGVTDQDGAYAIKGIPCPPGTESIPVEIDLLATNRGLVEGKSGDREKTVTIEPDKTEYRADFVLRTGKTVTGVLLQADGKPVTDAMVLIPSGLLGFARAAKDGTFSVGGAAPTGKSCLLISLGETQFIFAVQVSFQDEVSDKKDLGEIRLPDLAALGIAEVTGEVQPAEPERRGLFFSIWDVEHQWGFVVFVRDGNKFDRKGVIPGEYLVVCPGFWFDKAELVQAGQERGVALPRSLVVDIKAGQNHLQVDKEQVKKAWAEYEKAVQEAAAKRKDATK